MKHITKESGMILVAALIIMLLVSILAISVGKFTVRGQQQSSANYDKLKSYAAADAALSFAENFTATKTHPLALVNFVDTGLANNWWSSSSNWQMSQSNKIRQLAGYADGSAYYRLENKGFQGENLEAATKKGRYIYSVTSRGVSPGESVPTMQSLYALPN